MKEITDWITPIFQIFVLCTSSYLTYISFNANNIKQLERTQKIKIEEKVETLTLENIIAGFSAELTTQLEPIKADITSLNQRVGRIEEDIIIIKADVAELKIDVKQLQGDVAELKIDVKQLQGDVAELKIDVKQLQGDVAYIKSDVKSLLADSKTHSEKINATILNQTILVTELKTLRIIRETPIPR